LADGAIGRVAAVDERVDHRIFEMGAAPPGDEAPRLAGPALAREEWRDELGEPALHVDDGAVLIEGERLDVAQVCHGDCSPAVGWAKRRRRVPTAIAQLQTMVGTAASRP